MSGKRASIWLFQAPPRRRITGRPPTPRTGPLPGRRIRRRPSRCPIRPCGPGSSGTPAALTAASIPTSGSRPVRKQARPATRRPRRSPSASPALYAPSAWNCRCGLGISASTVSGVVWSPPTARHCAAGSTEHNPPGAAALKARQGEHDPRRPAERARRSVIPQRRLTPTPRSAQSRFGQKRSAPAHPSVICAAGFHRVIVLRPKGLPTTGELDANTTTYWNGGTPKASLRRRHHPFEGRPGVLRGRARPQPVQFWLWSLTCQQQERATRRRSRRRPGSPGSSSPVEPRRPEPRPSAGTLQHGSTWPPPTVSLRPLTSPRPPRPSHYPGTARRSPPRRRTARTWRAPAPQCRAARR